MSQAKFLYRIASLSCFVYLALTSIHKYTHVGISHITITMYYSTLEEWNCCFTKILFKFVLQLFFPHIPAFARSPGFWVRMIRISTAYLYWCSFIIGADARITTGCLIIHKMVSTRIVWCSTRFSDWKWQPLLKLKYLSCSLNFWKKKD